MNSRPKTPSRKVFGERISLFKQPASNNWFARFYVNRVKYQTTLKTADDKEADKRAEHWYIQTLGAIQNGFAPATSRSRSFAHCADEAIALYEQKAGMVPPGKSPRYVRELKIIYNKLNLIIGNTDIEAVDQSCWVRVRKALTAEKPNLSSKTLHQYKNAMQVCLSARVELGLMKEDDKPKFSRENLSHDDTPRTHFTQEEYEKLIQVLRKNIQDAKKIKNGNHREEAQARELLNFVVFATSCGGRIGEIRNMRFCDVEFRKELDGRANEKKDVLFIRNIKGKRSRNGECKTYFTAVVPFLNCMKRAGLTLQNYKQSDEPLFEEYHRDLFRRILEENNLRFDNSRTRRERHLASLRATYICMRLSAGDSAWWIAKNCRTSNQMIENHYAKYLSLENTTQLNRRPLRNHNEH